MTMEDITLEIRELVDRETKAWDTQDADLLVSIFHPDMVWAWPPDSRSHDPMNWKLELGRFDKQRWRNAWQELFDTHILAQNNRNIIKIEISKEKDGAFAVVDIDTLWVNNETGIKNHWKGRTCKVYTLTKVGWKLIMHTGALEYYMN